MKSHRLARIRDVTLVVAAFATVAAFTFMPIDAGDNVKRNSITLMATSDKQTSRLAWTSPASTEDPTATR